MRIPSIIFKTRVGDLAENGECTFENGKWVDITTESLFNNKKVVLFSLPGAFTPTCTSQQLPGFENNYKAFKFIHPYGVSIIKDGMEEPSTKAYFAATPRLLEAARNAIEALPPQSILSERFSKLSVGGNGVTGSVFVDNRNYREWTREVFNAEVTEMESAAVGQVCEINEVDWVIIRSISDLAGGQEGVNDEHIYDVEASRVAAALLFALLDELQIINV